jgi:hypothetical protein
MTNRATISPGKPAPFSKQIGIDVMNKINMPIVAVLTGSVRSKKISIDCPHSSNKDRFETAQPAVCYEGPENWRQVVPTLKEISYSRGCSLSLEDGDIRSINFYAVRLHRNQRHCHTLPSAPGRCEP